MEGKLIKVENGYVLMVNNIMYATDNDKLSLKNCQAIANGYDLDELACNEIGIDISVINHIDNKVIENDSVSTPIHEAGALGAGLYHRVKGFEIGFQKALEILGDKKYSEEDVKFMFQLGFNLDNAISRNKYDAHIQSLQQTEWDVEIEMKKVIDETKIVGAVKGVKGSGNKITTYKSVPKLDADGCLILRRC